MTMHVTDIVNI